MERKNIDGIDKLSEEAPESTLINDCLDALLYQDGERKPLTHTTLKFIEGAKPKLGEANVLFIEGVRLIEYGDAPFKLFAEAEAKGCKHPVLYYFMGDCYRYGRKGVGKDLSKAVEYFDMAIAGGCSWGYLGRSMLYQSASGQYEKWWPNIFDLEREGYLDGWVFNNIGGYYDRNRDSGNHTSTTAMKYFQLAIEHGCISGFEHLRRLMPHVETGIYTDIDLEVFAVLGPEKKSLEMKDDRLIHHLVLDLIDLSSQYHPNPQVLGKFKDRIEMALNYCDILIEMKSPFGYKHMAETYRSGCAGVDDTMPKVVSIMEEADKAGLADSETYYSLQRAYRYGEGVSCNGRKVLEYGEKALKVATSNDDVQLALTLMIDVYQTGLHPVGQDGRKVIECYERAIHIVTSISDKKYLYRKLAAFYTRGVHPVAPNGAKALECYIKAIQLADTRKRDGLYYDIAKLYESGIRPISQNLERARELMKLA